MNNENNCYEGSILGNALKEMKHQKCCCPRFIPGPTGPTGPIGPTGPAASSASCFCVDQMRNIIQQIITLYPNNNLIVAMESGNNASGRPGSLLPGPDSNPNSGLFQLLNA